MEKPLMKIKYLRSSDRWADESTRIAESFGALILALKTNDLRSHGSLPPGGWASLPRGLRLLMSASDGWVSLEFWFWCAVNAQVSRTCFPKEVVIVSSERRLVMVSRVYAYGGSGVCLCFRYMYMFQVFVAHIIYICVCGKYGKQSCVTQ